MQLIKYKGKYLSESIVDQCFNQSNNFQFVDKTLTGNGFTTSYLKIKPTSKNQSNIIIVPNRGVIISKQEKYIATLKNGTEEEKNNLPNIGFFYGDISADKFEFHTFDIMMFVVDSFVNYKKQILDNKHFIDKILIDEAHSVQIQSTFRQNLVNFIEDIKTDFSDKKVVCVTATPMLFNNVDIRLAPEEIEQRKIHISTNQESTLKRIKEALNNKENCIIALQDVRILKKLANEDGVLNANLKIGKTLFLKSAEAVNLELNEDSNLTIISSAGFEGFDVENGVNNFFLFEDRAFDYQTFYAQNGVQAIGRSRQGTNYIEWCTLPNQHRTKMLSKEEMIKKASSKRISNEKKLTDKNYKFIPKYFDYNQDLSFGLITDFKLNHTKYDLDAELIENDLKGLLAVYKDFFKDRGFELVFLNEGSKRLSLRNVSHKIAFKNMKLNTDIIEEKELMKGLKLNIYRKENIEGYIKEFEIYFRRKYYFLDELPFVLDDCLEDSTCSRLNNLENELFAYSILKDEKSINGACSLICKEAITKKKKEINRNSKEFETWKEDLITNIKDRYIRLIMAFSQNKIRIPKKIRNSRDYNLFTEVSMDLISAVSDLFEVDCYEFDIRTCNSRIIYSMVGLKLPNNFYGEGKKNKKKINTILNTLSSEYPKKYKLDVPKYKKNKVAELRKLGFDEKVISFLINNFWKKSIDAIFNFCAYHEKKIIENLTKDIEVWNTEGIVRRHDSIIYFGEFNEVQIDILENFTYKNQKGWLYNEVSIEEIINENIEENAY